MNKPAQKFMFNTDFRFGTGLGGANDQTEERDVQAEIDQAYQNGVLAGRNLARSEHDAILARAQADIATQLTEISQKLDHDIRQIEDRAGRIALHFAKALTAQMIEQQPTTLIETAFVRCLGLAGQTPSMTITTSQELVQSLQENLKQKALESGYNGEIQFSRNSALSVSGVTIQWADGGLNFDPERISSEVEIVARDFFQSQLNAKGL